MDIFSQKNLIFIFILFRLTNCYLVRTWYAPDEYWQSQEVAHYLAFKYKIKLCYLLPEPVLNLKLYFWLT
jgi:hypothetical protein